MPSQGCFVLTRDKAHSAAQRKKKAQSNLFCRSIEFPRQPGDGGGTSVSTNIPCALLLQPSGEGFLFTFFFGLLEYKIKSFGSKFQLSVFTHLSKSALSVEFVPLSQNTKRHWTRCERQGFSARCLFIVSKFRHHGIYVQNHGITAELSSPQ